MRLLSYRKRLFLKRLFKVLLIVVLLIGTAWLFSIAYLDRYIVYDRDGAHVDKKWELRIGTETPRKENNIHPHVTELSAVAEGSTSSLRRLSGCYVTLAMLKDVPGVRAAIAEGEYRTIYIQLKDHFGNFYYRSQMAGVPLSSVVNTSEVSALISELVNDGCYVIGAIPAMADQKYCLNHVDLGLPLASGALWVDDDYCYYMDPAKAGSRDYIEAIATELYGMGLREVVLEDYEFPNAPEIVYNENTKTKADVLNETAQILQEDLGERIQISFEISLNGGFTTAMNAGRLYFDFADTNSLASAVTLFSNCVLSPELQLVFVNNSHDTRFDEYGHFLPVID